MCSAAVAPAPTRLLVSACLLGAPVRYDGSAKPCRSALLARWQAEGRVLPFCPELAGGLAVPRPAAEIAPGGSGAAVLAGQARVRLRDGQDLSSPFVAGARQALALMQAQGLQIALLKEGSPSCGPTLVNDGHFAGRKIAGQGVTAALLRSAGLQVFSEHQLEQIEALLQRLDGLSRAAASG